MQQAILIGREPDTTFKLEGFDCKIYIVPQIKDPNHYISRQHCIIKRTDNNEFEIIDGFLNQQGHIQSSSNGTFVNDISVSNAFINANTKINLARTLDISISNLWQEVFSLDINITQYRQEHKDDYREHFKALKPVYEDYKKAIIKTKRNFNLKSNGIKLPLTVLSTAVVSNCGLTDFKSIIVTLISGIGVFLTKKIDLSEDLFNVEKKFRNKYCCPKCKEHFNIEKDKNVRWEELYEEKGKCINRNCNARFNDKTSNELLNSK
jgi:pSer/pThr/pTyr-binding forkhead associated (FHA) protein